VLWEKGGREDLMKIGVVITTKEPETAWSALRLANKAMEGGDDVGVFLLGPGVDYREGDSPQFDISEQARTFVDYGGLIQA
jgi:hypothetical protein